MADRSLPRKGESQISTGNPKADSNSGSHQTELIGLLYQNLFDHVPVHIRQPEVAALEAESFKPVTIGMVSLANRSTAGTTTGSL
jgi:hypothetical protein